MPNMPPHCVFLRRLVHQISHMGSFYTTHLYFSVKISPNSNVSPLSARSIEDGEIAEVSSGSDFVNADQQAPTISTNTFRGGSFATTGDIRTSSSSNNMNHGSSNNLSQANNPSGDKPMPRNASANSLEERNSRSGAGAAPGVGSANSNPNNSGNSGWKASANPRSSQPLQGPHQYRQGQGGGYQYAQSDYQGSQGPHRASRGQSESMSRGRNAYTLCS